MIQLKTGQHFGKNKTTLPLNDAIIVEAGYFPNIEVPWHYHENAYFYYHLKGQLEEVNKVKRYPCLPGTALFHFWQEPHCNRKFSHDALYYHVEFKRNWFDRHFIKPDKLEGDFQLDSPLFQNIFQKIYIESKLNDASSQLAIDGLCLQAFAEMIRLPESKLMASPSWVKRVREILNDSFGDNISLSYLAIETGLHPAHLSREFPRYFHMNFGSYLRKVRLGKSAAMLHTTCLSIADIAYRCGFADESHYIRWFKVENKMTPHQFRKKLRENYRTYLFK